jgi:hypothetical protein
MRSLAHGAAVESVAADRAAVLVTVCGVVAVAVGDDGTGLLTSAGVSAREALRETGHVGERAEAAAATHAAVAGTGCWLLCCSHADEYTGGEEQN